MDPPLAVCQSLLAFTQKTDTIKFNHCRTLRTITEWHEIRLRRH